MESSVFRSSRITFDFCSEYSPKVNPFGEPGRTGGDLHQTVLNSVTETELVKDEPQRGAEGHVVQIDRTGEVIVFSASVRPAGST